MSYFYFLIIVGLLSACGSGKEATDNSEEEMDHRTEVRLRQYMVQGKRLYLTHCANCHQKNGEGLAQLYPPLAKSDYLMSDIKRAACIIKNGVEGEITVDGRVFSQPMPGIETLTPIEVAEILTYVTNSWGNEAGISSTRDVSIWLKKCKE